MKGKDIYLVCGVPGSGKTWVCDQLKSKFEFIPHDDHKTGAYLFKALKSAASNKPLLTDCPYAERELKESLEKAGFTVHPYFVIESLETVSTRFKAREKRDLPKAFATRVGSIEKRVKEWKAKSGTSEEVLKMLKAVA